MSARLDDRVAIVTGAGQGSGRGAALALAREGARVALLGRTLSKLEAVRNDIIAAGGEALAVTCDIGDVAQIKATVDDIAGRWGRIDILVNAAQSPEVRSGALLDVDADVMQQLWQTGPVASLEMMRACYSWLKKQGGSIINFGSGAQFAPAGFGVYAGVKAAIQTITRAAAEEWGPDGIRANVVVPFMRSPAFDKEFEDKPAVKEAIRNSIPLRRFGAPETDLGGAVAFLAGDESGFITGQMLMLDGGQQFYR